MSAFECRVGEVRIAVPQRGFTLIELMVGLLLSGIILFALVTLFGNNSRMRNEIDRATQQIENGRYALDLIRDDLHLAGYYGDVLPQSGYSAATAAVPTNVELCDTTAGSTLRAFTSICLRCNGRCRSSGLPAAIRRPPVSAARPAARKPGRTFWWCGARARSRPLREAWSPDRSICRRPDATPSCSSTRTSRGASAHPQARSICKRRAAAPRPISAAAPAAR